MPNSNLKTLIIEFTIYGVLVTIYALAALRWVSQPLNQLFNTNIYAYAFVGLVLIIAQCSVLERITSFILERFDLHNSE
ncbi:MAG TPA: hypothetical protein DGM69_08055 [Chloroflexi bacterium]|nr:hypothetical protein [Chloroflexota bacterium]|tara:strand:- start:145 stop:381 length:237 start_codon:yes stop_codon:yes gene_type:complete